jgi:hypothetical protein
MRFKAFLQEGISGNRKDYMKDGLFRSKAISREQAIELVRTKHKRTMDFDVPLMVRGTNKHNITIDDDDETTTEESYQHAVPSMIQRISANTANYYTLLLDSFESWNNYPNRSRSLICTSLKGFNNASEYGSVFIVLPCDGAKIGVCSDNDIWVSFKPLCKALSLGDMGDFTYVIEDLLDASECPHGIFAELKNIKVFKSGLDFITKWLQDSNNDTKRYASVMKPVITGKLSLYEYFEQLMSPEFNGFSLASYSDLVNFKTKERELYTDADSILISPADEKGHRQGVLKFYTEFRKEVLGT